MPILLLLGTLLRRRPAKVSCHHCATLSLAHCIFSHLPPGGEDWVGKGVEDRGRDCDSGWGTDTAFGRDRYGLGIARGDRIGIPSCSGGLGLGLGSLA